MTKNIYIENSGLVTLHMILSEPGAITILYGTGAMTGCSALAFVLSYPLAVHIYSRKEY